MRTLLALAFSLGLAARVEAARLKELVDVEGFRGNILTGVGLVVGLAGTGDDLVSLQTRRPLAAVLRHLGTNIDPSEIRARNVAIVMVTTTLPPFARQGSRVDVVVSSAGTARSLQGGTLVATALKGLDKEVYALAQGPITVGGYVAEGASGSQHRRNHPTAARIPGGGILERDAPATMPTDELVLALHEPDATTAVRIVEAINKSIGDNAAKVRDPGAVVIALRDKWRGHAVELVATVEALEATPDVAARVIIDERTGTIAVGANVTLGAAAVAHGGMTVRVDEKVRVSQPQALATGSTTATPDSSVEVDEDKGQLVTLKGAATVGDVAAALNALGVRPRELVSILQALRAAGALRAEIQTM